MAKQEIGQRRRLRPKLNAAEPRRASTAVRMTATSPLRKQLAADIRARKFQPGTPAETKLIDHLLDTTADSTAHQQHQIPRPKTAREVALNRRCSFLDDERCAAPRL